MNIFPEQHSISALHIINVVILIKMFKMVTHLSPETMAAILQTTFSKAFRWMKSFVIWFEFHWSLSWKDQLKISNISSGNGFAPNRRQATAWINADPVTDANMQHKGEMS